MHTRLGLQLLLHPGIFKAIGGKLGNYKSMCAWRLLPHFWGFFPYYILASMMGLSIVDPLGPTVNGTFQDM